MKLPVITGVVCAMAFLSAAAAAATPISPKSKLKRLAAVETKTVKADSSEVDVKVSDAKAETKPVSEAVAKDAAAKNEKKSEKKVAALAPEEAPKAKPKPVAPTLVASVDLTKQRMTVTENGHVKYVWKISSGRSGYRTPTGSYKPKWMSRMHYSRQYNNSPMPHSVFFHKGYAVHATYYTKALGAPASHGCIRLAPASARKFYKLVQKHSMSRTRIKLHGVAKDRKRTYAKKYKKRKTKKYANYHNHSTWYMPPTAYTWPGDRPRRYSRKRRVRRYGGY